MTCSTRISTTVSLPAQPSPYLRTLDAAHTTGAVSMKSGTQTEKNTGKSTIFYLLCLLKRTITSDYCEINNGRDFSLPFRIPIIFYSFISIFILSECLLPFPSLFLRQLFLIIFILHRPVLLCSHIKSADLQQNNKFKKSFISRSHFSHLIGFYYRGLSTFPEQDTLERLETHFRDFDRLAILMGILLPIPSENAHFYKCAVGSY